MTAKFSFQIDPARDLVRIAMSGLFTPADIADFTQALRQAHERLRCARNAHVTLNDLRGLKIQSQEVVGQFRALLAAPGFRSRRLAFVIEKTLARGQLKRALGDRDSRCFENPVAAEAWLLEIPSEWRQPRRAAG